MEERDAIEQTLLQRDNLVKVGLPVPVTNVPEASQLLDRLALAGGVRFIGLTKGLDKSSLYKFLLKSDVLYEM